MIDFRQNEFSGDLKYERQRIIRKKDWGILLIVGLIVTGIVTGITYSGTSPMAVGCTFANRLLCLKILYWQTSWEIYILYFAVKPKTPEQPNNITGRNGGFSTMPTTQGLFKWSEASELNSYLSL